MKFNEFVKKLKNSYTSDKIEIRNEPSLRPNSEWIFLNVERFYRAFVFLKDYIKAKRTDKLVLCDVGAYPFTFLKIVKLFYPKLKLYSIGIHDEDLIPSNIKKTQIC